MSKPNKFKVCPDQLPDLEDFHLLCENGCYLFHEDDERAARFNKTRVLEIPKLQLALQELTLQTTVLQAQRDNAIVDAEYLTDKVSEGLQRNADLAADLEGAYSLGDVALTFAGGAGAGIVLYIAGQIVRGLVTN